MPVEWRCCFHRRTSQCFYILISSQRRQKAISIPCGRGCHTKEEFIALGVTRWISNHQQLVFVTSVAYGRESAAHVLLQTLLSHSTPQIQAYIPLIRDCNIFTLIAALIGRQVIKTSFVCFPFKCRYSRATRSHLLTGRKLSNHETPCFCGFID